MQPTPTIKILQQQRAQQAASQLDLQKFQTRSKQLEEIKNSVYEVFNTLIRHMDGKTTKTEVVNQLKSISTPDVNKVVQAVEKLDKSISDKKPDYSEITKAIQSMSSGLTEQLKKLPRDFPEFVQRESVSISNLKKLEDNVSKVEKALMALEVQPQVNVEKPDLLPIIKSLESLSRAFNSIRIPQPDSPFSKKIEVVDGSVPTHQMNVMVSEKFDRFEIVYDDFDDESSTVEAIKYYLGKKLVATVKYSYTKDGLLKGANKV